MDFLLSGLAACGACVFTNPLEVVKTRMQLQGELQAPGSYQRHYRNVFHAFITIGKVDGPAALQKGLVPALIYQFLMNGIRLGTYGLAEAGGYLCTAEGTLSPPRSAAAGALAGVLGAYLGSPIYMVKTHLQAQAASAIAVGHQYKHQGMFQALTQIGQKHGLVGLWRGSLGGLPRVVVGSSAQLCTFSSTKDLISQWEVFPSQSWKVALVAAMVSGIVVVLAMTPFDVASTRLYNQPTDGGGKGLMYRGILDALLQTARTEGIWGMYKGIGASYFRLGPHTILSLFFWDQLRSLYSKYTK
ncbi:solute carrier family 25 member 35 [Echinops telfairi]|uniref:Solute carrier family 25 member 35 n=2 Tax=Echinops telfairi TaxID=9371 RepID=A0AC55DC74_ECHTE|nr:solute carrier family 25 member 35 [Echinops telfairi]XP_045149337.1 solute carrier family 25 member 35 [Echinops telfairi]